MFKICSTPIFLTHASSLIVDLNGYIFEMDANIRKNHKNSWVENIKSYKLLLIVFDGFLYNHFFWHLTSLARKCTTRIYKDF